MRVWGGGLLEDQHFYDECDRLGLMLLQEFPHAGCSPGGPGDSFPDLATRLPLDDAQTKMAVKQLVNHPSIVRYNYANEFYLNSSVSPFIAQVRKETPSSSSFSSQRRADKTKIDDSPRQARDKRKECSPQNSRSRCVFSRSFSQRCAQSTTHAQCTKPTRHVSQSVTDRIHSVWRSMRRTERSVETAQVRATISHRSFACLELPCSLDIGKTEQLIAKMGVVSQDKHTGNFFKRKGKERLKRTVRCISIVLEGWMTPGAGGCASQGDNGGNPFEWDEFGKKTRLFLRHFMLKRMIYQDRLGTNIHTEGNLKKEDAFLLSGATGLSDLDTLRGIIPADELATGWQGTISPSWSFHRLATWGDVHGYRPLFSKTGAAAKSLKEEVQWSQFMQAEGLRFSFQAHRRAKPHRSAANSWTFDEPWPNAAHGSMLAHSGT
jgi:hypothetical protein